MKIVARILVIILMIACHFCSTTYFVWSSAILYLVVVLLSVVSVIQFWKSSEHLKVCIPEILLLIFVVYIYLNNAFNGTFSGNSNLFNYLILLLAYFSFSLLYSYDKSIFRFVFFKLLNSTLNLN